MTAMLSGADRQRAYRARFRRGKRVERVVRVTVSNRVLEALLNRGMAEADSRNRKKLGEELTVLVNQWAEEWFAKKKA